MRHVGWIGLVVAGCYAPSYDSGTPCSTACPGDLVCVDRICREPGFMPLLPDAPLPAVDGPPGDVDADGIANPADNCPTTANADQHDEDMDANGDACDPCPHLAGNLADTDGDKIGDACDPQPMIGKQVLRFFDPFTADRTEWRHDPGVVRVGETLRLFGAGYTELPVTTGALRIAIAGTVDSIQPGAEHQFAIAFGFNADVTRYHYCELYDNAGTEGATYISEAIDNTYPALASIPYQGTMPLGELSFQIDESVLAQQIRLESSRGGQQQMPLTVGTSGAPALASSSYLSMFVQGVDLRLRYIWVVETLP